MISRTYRRPRDGAPYTIVLDGRALRAWREAQDATLAMLADVLGVSRQAVLAYEQERAIPSRGVAATIAKLTADIEPRPVAVEEVPA